MDNREEQPFKKKNKGKGRKPHFRITLRDQRVATG